MNKKGATSILIIMLMVVLMVFGLTILTATLSNETLSDKKFSWIEDYYLLEADAQVQLAQLDATLQDLKLQVISSSGDLTRSQAYQKLINDMYDDYNHIFMTVSRDQGDYKKYIDMDIQCYIPSDTVSDEDFLQAENYAIMAYVQTQDLFDYEEIEFGVPFAPE